MSTIAHPQAQFRQRESAWKTCAVVLPFLLLFWLNIAHHTMFFDEVNAWAIGAASPDLKTLFHYVHFEGHPWLWYFILWFPSRLTHDPVGMKWVEAALGTAVIFILGTRSPFTARQRILLLSSYFLVWEYTVMCRMYSVMLLLTLFYVLRRSRSDTGVVGNCVLLGLVGNTDMTGVLLSGALLLEYAFHTYLVSPVSERRALLRKWIPALVLYAALIGLSIASLLPAKQISWQSSGHIGSQALVRQRIERAVGNMIAAPWWPISHEFPHHFWETSIKDQRWLVLLIPFVLFAYWKTFRKDRNLLLLMGSTLAFGILFADLVYEGRVRHWGIAFVSFVVGLWLQSAHMKYVEQRKPIWSAWAYSLLALSAVAGVFALIGSWAHPFSRARETALWLKQNEPPTTAIVGAPDVSFASVAEEMQRPVYFLECGCVDTFKLFSRSREDFAETEIPWRLNRALNDLRTQQLIFVFYRPLQPEDTDRLHQADLSAVPIKAFPGADSALESYFLYQISREPEASVR